MKYHLRAATCYMALILNVGAININTYTPNAYVKALSISSSNSNPYQSYSSVYTSWGKFFTFHLNGNFPQGSNMDASYSNKIGARTYPFLSVALFLAVCLSVSSVLQTFDFIPLTVI